MSLKNEDLIKLKIDIKSKSKYIFQEIAFLVDKPIFLEEVNKARKKLKLEKLIDIESYKDWIRNHPPGTKGKSSELDILLKSVANIRKLIKRSIHYNQIIIQAILCGAVNEEAWQPVYVDIVFDDYYIKFPAVIIYPTSKTRNKDILMALRKTKEFYKKNNDLAPSPTSSLDPISKIKIHRKWYWEKISGKTYTEIWNECFDTYKNKTGKRGLDLSLINKAIVNYKKLLLL